MLLFLFFEHQEHALRNGKASKNVDTGQDNGNQAEDFGRVHFGDAGGNQRSDDNNARDGVRNAHQRRMQSRRNARDIEISDKAGQGLNGENSHDICHLTAPSLQMQVLSTNSSKKLNTICFCSALYIGAKKLYMLLAKSLLAE